MQFTHFHNPIQYVYENVVKNTELRSDHFQKLQLKFL